MLGEGGQEQKEQCCLVLPKAAVKLKPGVTAQLGMGGSEWVHARQRSQGARGTPTRRDGGHRLTSLTRLKKLANAGLLAAGSMLFFS
jgi:hypothetical protein